ARLALAFALALPALARAQGQQEERVRTELARVERERQRNQAEIERLLDLRLRHDLGLPVEPDRQLAAATPVTPEAMERARAELRDQNDETARQLEEYDRLRAMVDKFRTDVL